MPSWCRLGVVCLLSLALTACDFLKDGPASPTGAAPPVTALPIFYTAFGASDALGIGSSRPCGLFVACDDGSGYVQLLVRDLRASREITVTNAGVPAAVLSPTIFQLARSIGRDVPANFIDHELLLLSSRSTLVTIFGGANDVNVVAAAMQQGAAGADVRGYIDARVREFGADYDRLVISIQQRAPSAFIIVINLPNLAGLPYAAGLTLLQRQVLQQLSVGFTLEINRQARAGVAVLDLMCDENSYDRANLSADGFHPNDAGYQLLEQRLLPVVNGTPSIAPSTCGQMSLFPAIP